MIKNLITIASVFISILVLMFLSDVITIGEKLARVTHLWYVEYCFYGILALAFIYFIIWPVIRLHCARPMPALTSEGMDNVAEMKKFGQVLYKSCDYIPDPERRQAHAMQLRYDVEHWNDADNLRAVLDQELTLRIEGNKDENIRGLDQIIKDWSRTVFMATAVSPNSKIDAFSVLVLDFSMMKNMILATGFRPSNLQMWRLYIRILATALLSYMVSDALTDVGDIRPDSMFGHAHDIPAQGADGADDVMGEADAENSDFSLGGVLAHFRIPGFIAGPVLDGTANALLALRIGYVTKAYLVEGVDRLKDDKLRKQAKLDAIASAIKDLPQIVIKGSAGVGRGVGKAMYHYFGSDDWKRYENA